MKTFLSLVLMTASLFLAGCEKARLDQEVDRLCRLDGGIKVYETVKLSKEDYDEKRRIVFPQFIGLPEDKGRYGTNYIVVSKDSVLRDGNPSLRRSHIQVIRVSDKKVLGERINYTRFGGDMPNPFHPSSYACQNVIDNPGLIRQVFIEGESK
ncbi:MAG: hypothetical protein K8F53_10165 [Rhodocyclaceae bacterium]|nr:hypothetical protein [Rhodocyclaceae bacterium]